MIAKLRENKIQIQFDYDPALVAVVKSLPGRVWHQPLRSWFLPLKNAAASVEKLKSFGFSIEPELEEAVAEDVRRLARLSELAGLSDTNFESSLPLMPHQRVGAAFLDAIGSGLLGDDMGLGKTIQSLAFCEKIGARKVLVFCPSSVKYQWEDEIKKFIPDDCATVVIDGTAARRRKQWAREARFYIANYELLPEWRWSYERGDDGNYVLAKGGAKKKHKVPGADFPIMQRTFWDVIIADEATKISDPSTHQSKSIKKLNAHHKIAMTGTPVSNKAEDVWNIIDFIKPDSLGSYWNFMNRYCVRGQFNRIISHQNLPELRERLGQYMIRRLKKEVLKDLPEKITTDIPFKLSAKEKKLYDNLRKEILFEIEKTDIDKIENPMSLQYTLVKMTRLRQLADSMELLGHNAKSSKLEVLREKLAETMADPQRKAIIFTQFAEMAEILERELAEYAPLVVSGKIKEEYRDVVEKFNTDDSRRLLIMTSAGQFGLNIQRASVIFHFDQEWSLAKMEQRDGRAHRIGQKDTVLVYNLLAKGTIDYYVKKVLHDKAKISGQVLGDSIPVSMDNIREMLNYE